MVRGEPYLALNALVLSDADRRCLERLTAVFSRVFHRAGQRVAADVAATIALGFPWAAAELLAREPRRLPLIGRFDFVQDVTGRWRLLELNADTPSGVREGIACDRLVSALLPEAAGARAAQRRPRPPPDRGDPRRAHVAGVPRDARNRDHRQRA